MNSTSDYPSTWLLLDDRAGNRTQVSGIANRLGWPCEVKEIRYNALAALPNQLLRNKLWHLTPDSKEKLKAPYPQLVISAGRRTAPVALNIRQHSPETRLVHCMWPDIMPGQFDLIIAPEHDKHKRTAANMLYTLGAPHGITQERLQKEAERWHARVSRLPAPYVALIVGGSTKDCRYTPEDFKTLAAHASAEAERLGGSLIVTSSPRTGKEGCDAIRRLLTVPHYFHEWNSAGDNPYIAFLALANALIVTGDSVSMCSEVCTLGKPTYLFAPPHAKNKKQIMFREALLTRGHAKSHTSQIDLQWKPVPLPDAAAIAAHMIREHFSLEQKPVDSIAGAA